MNGNVITEEVIPGIQYSRPSYHRDGTPNKSKWTITVVEEKQVFVNAHSSNWLSSLDNDGWGCHRISGSLEYLGIGQDQCTKVFISKYVCSRANVNDWHGFPADHQSNTQDIPPSKILFDWQKIGIINKPQMRRIMKGQPCSL